jgi:hypothetical protein
MLDISKINVVLLIVLMNVLSGVMNPANSQNVFPAKGDTVYTDTIINNMNLLQVDSVSADTAKRFFLAGDSIHAGNTTTDVIPTADTTDAAMSDSLDIMMNDSLDIADDSLIIRKGTVKKEKEKPDTLVTYFFKDTLRYDRVIVWTINRYLNVPNLATPDTLQRENMTELPFYREDVGVSYLGTTGSATLLHDFFKRKEYDLFPFMNPYSLYGFTPDNIRFYNTKGPFSSVAYYTSGNKRVAEDNIKALITRNMSPSLNVGLYYQKMGAKGTYQNQRTKDKTFNMFVSFVGK